MAGEDKYPQITPITQSRKSYSVLLLSYDSQPHEFNRTLSLANPIYDCLALNR